MLVRNGGTQPINNKFINLLTDVAMHLERTWSVRIPGHTPHLEGLDRAKKPPFSDMHKKRLSLIKKTHEEMEREQRRLAARNKRKKLEENGH